MASITDLEKSKLDELFDTLSLVSEGADVFLCDMKYDYSRWSKSAVDFYEMPGEYMTGAGEIWINRIHPADREKYRENIEDLFSGKIDEHNIQYRAVDKNGIYNVCTCKGHVMIDAEYGPRYFAGVIRNQTAGGYIDRLTGLANQQAFFRDVKQKMDDKESMNIVLLGTSHFTKFNDMYGYDFGNRLLQHAARYIQDMVSDMGELYRLDGIKLALVTNRSIEEIQDFYSRLKDIVEANFRLDGKLIDLPVNGGAVEVDTFEIDVNTIYSCLTHAYEQSKYEAGGSLVVFENGVSEKTREKLSLLTRIRNCVAMGCRGFMLFYQPIVDAKTEKLIGAEALIRWRDKDGQMVPPNDFIPVLENDSQFPVLGEWILREAMRQGKKIIESYPDFVMSINLSYAQIQKIDFVNVVEKAMEDMDYPAKNLCLEITERCRLIDMDRLESVTFQLHQDGIKIAMDDFGTGFSSLYIMQHVECDTVKVDRSFVKDVEIDEREEKLVSVITDLSKIYGAATCVEGIETEGMRDVLRKYPVTSFQGYLYSRPLPFYDFMKKYGA
ncbi:MAG: EAL domain-containing protein [Lachnospiraceae bacterium]|nr:EAL domain-containing protein [Lachnospiraceae bacterium]